ncbi:Ni/Fe hydrogenase subunit alpha [Roseiconus nitratireducens]|uniref:Ni/Fe hydrogenase subunit alpha n=1 Tax=Roseiconus nitratireducens TaxID=2605748 RepID=A0A5M6DHQ1_9BACT|nr:Ni/Fe hydrogenase subunit alpha [Roseiconus nitratireducens]KAA5547077.1 Ni/Fe hydrogenase subunit alpha [Roseiconus nitratireducens]
MSSERIITVRALTRVEGEGALHVRLDGDEVEDVRLSIYEAPRFFEAFLRERSIEDVPDLTARICGICPVAYQMSSVHALEAALGITITPTIRRLRRLMYCGEWIESHSLHVFLLHAADFFGCASGIELARQFPQQVNDGLQIKQAGNALLEVLGGRAIHPVNVRIGGFHRLPAAGELTALLPKLREARSAAIAAADWIAEFEFPACEFECEWVALTHPDEYPMNAGLIGSTRFPAIEVDEFEDHFEETQVHHSTALHATRRERQTPYLLGPLSRLNLNRDRLRKPAREIAQRLLPQRVIHNRFLSIAARLVEIVHCLDEAIESIQDYRAEGEASCRYAARSGRGCAATEAPRGTLYHAYEISDDGRVRRAKIVPPTSQNQRQIETDLAHFLPAVLDQPDDQIALSCEKLIRSYDPCISCSTHFLKLTMERR